MTTVPVRHGAVGVVPSSPRTSPIRRISRWRRAPKPA